MMKKCTMCGTENLEASQFCEQCGARLDLLSAAPPSGERQAKQTDFRAQISELPVFQSSAGATSIGVPPAAFEPSASVAKQFSGEFEKSNGASRATLTIERGGAAGAKFAVHANESNIGRWDADNGIFPDVDLDKHDPEAKISRRHARIVKSGEGIYSIEDLGSTNGTFVNRGRRLIPGDKTILKDGDEIIVGKTFLRFNIGE